MGKFNYFIYKEKRFEKFSIQEQTDLIFDLINSFSIMRNPIDTALLIQDLLTEKEIKNLAKRLRIAKLILADNTTEEIVKQMHCSAATVSKVRAWLDNAGQGLRRVVQRLPQHQQVYWLKKKPGIGYTLPDIIFHYATVYAKAQERKRLTTFLGGMRVKTAIDRELREKTKDEFIEKRRKRK